MKCTINSFIKRGEGNTAGSVSGDIFATIYLSKINPSEHESSMFLTLSGSSHNSTPSYTLLQSVCSFLILIGLWLLLEQTGEAENPVAAWSMILETLTVSI